MKQNIEQLKLAHSEGKTIQALVQFYVGFQKQWVDVPSPIWNPITEYRVKPESIKRD